MELRSKTNFQLTKYDSYLFHEGSDYFAYQKMGAHPAKFRNNAGTLFNVWAPKAKSVSVITSANDWDEGRGAMKCRLNGIWELFVPGAKAGDVYKYVIIGADGKKRYKADPFAFASELRPGNDSVIADLDGYEWTDGEYMINRTRNNTHSSPMAIYEVHLGSWKKDYRLNKDGFLNYRKLADELASYVNYMGYTHVELIGICEHPFDGSWGYQCSGFFAPTSRYGSPDDFRYFVDTMHRAGIAVILDWVPAHFPKDAFCLCEFDGTHLYESEDPLRAEYPEWGTLAFDYNKGAVRGFLISSAMYWINEFHIDAIRADAVSAIFYNSFGRGEWRPNMYGGVENLEGMDFIRQLNKTVHERTSAIMIAEDSSMMPAVTTAIEDGGFGFDYKWSLGWMNDTLKYMEKDPVYRRYHHEQLTHTFDYAFTENWILVLSHDEVVHLKHAMLEKMPGTLADKLGGLKTLYTLQMTHPGKKLLFMAQDFAEDKEWSESREIDWYFASEPGHRDVMLCVRELLSLYKTYSCLHVDSCNASTFEWINRNDYERNIICFIRRRPEDYSHALVVIFNFSPVYYPDYSCGVPLPGKYTKVFSTYIGEDDYQIEAKKDLCDGLPFRLSCSLRPNEALIFEIPEGTL